MCLPQFEDCSSHRDDKDLQHRCADANILRGPVRSLAILCKFPAYRRCATQPFALAPASKALCASAYQSHPPSSHSASTQLFKLYLLAHLDLDARAGSKYVGGGGGGCGSSKAQKVPSSLQARLRERTQVQPAPVKLRKTTILTKSWRQWRQQLLCKVKLVRGTSGRIRCKLSLCASDVITG